LTLLLYTHPSALGHDTGDWHPESPVRIRAILEAVGRAAIAGLERREPPEASRAQLLRAHPERYVAMILDGAPKAGHRRLDPDTVMSPGSAEAALRAAGAACAAVDAVMAGEATAAFSAMRPPGHHAEPERAMGFCLFNNVAIGALQARHAHGIEKIAILDFDVHHGNGTQAIFWDDPLTLYVSTHQSPLYPGTGFLEETGVAGNVMNRPMPPGTGSAAWRKVVERDVLPAIDAWRPELVMLSAGFDAHEADPLAQMRLTEADFAWVTREMRSIAERHAKGRVVSVLEGGYDPPALGRSVVAHLMALAEAAE
jgi:acetoin utilization deacetylase AcuC-like enzyme